MSGEEALQGFQAALLDDDAEQLYDRAPCGYLSTTPDGTIIKVNQTFLTLTGLAREDLVGRRTFAQLLTPGGQIFHETHFAPMLRLGGQAGSIALEIVRGDGTRLPVLVNAVLERDADAQPVVVRAAVFDATERRAYEQELLRERKRAEESEARAVALAHTLQRVLIPPEPPVVDGLEIAAAYRPAHQGDEVGGDFYDFFQTSGGDWVLAVGDVCGKGAEAAVITGLVRHSLRAVMLHPERPKEALHTLNALLLRHSERFATVALAFLQRQPSGWSVILTCAGHPPPLLVRAGRRPEFIGTAGSLVGAVDQAVFHEDRFELGPGDALLLYTDGVPEGRRGSEFYEDDRLVRATAEGSVSAAAMVHSVLSDVLDFQEGDPRDDIALMAVRVREQDG